MMFFSSPGQTYFISLFGGDIRQYLSLSHGEFGADLFSCDIKQWSGLSDLFLDTELQETNLEFIARNKKESGYSL